MRIKDFYLAIAGALGWVKYLKNGGGEVLSFMKLFLHCIFCAEYFIG